MLIASHFGGEKLNVNLFNDNSKEGELRKKDETKLPHKKSTILSKFMSIYEIKYLASYFCYKDIYD